MWQAAPRELYVLALENERLFYDPPFRARAAAAIEVAGDPQYLGADIGFLSILHTWDRSIGVARVSSRSRRRNRLRINTALFRPATAVFCTDGASWNPAIRTSVDGLRRSR